MDHYEVLGVPRNASSKAIQQAYRRLSRLNHPDVSKDEKAEAKFRRINEAYKALSNPQKRREYDGESSHRYVKDPDAYARELWTNIF